MACCTASWTATCTASVTASATASATAPATTSTSSCVGCVGMDGRAVESGGGHSALASLELRRQQVESAASHLSHIRILALLALLILQHQPLPLFLRLLLLRSMGQQGGEADERGSGAAAQEGRLASGRRAAAAAQSSGSTLASAMVLGRLVSRMAPPGVLASRSTSGDRPRPAGDTPRLAALRSSSSE